LVQEQTGLAAGEVHEAAAGVFPPRGVEREDVFFVGLQSLKGQRAGIAVVDEIPGQNAASVSKDVVGVAVVNIARARDGELSSFGGSVAGDALEGNAVDDRGRVGVEVVG